jgi:hypothetical protein
MSNCTITEVPKDINCNIGWFYLCILRNYCILFVFLCDTLIMVAEASEICR